MTKKGLKVLEGLTDVHNVYCSRDKGVQKDYYDEIKDLCKERGVIFSDRVENPVINGFGISVGWRWLIKTDKPLYVLHESKLPKYKGWSPLVNQLINGEKEIYVTGIKATDKFDEGPVVCYGSIKIKYPISVSTVIDELCDLYVDLCSRIPVGNFLIKDFKSESESYSMWRDEYDYEINWNQSAKKIKRFIDSVGFPYKGAKTKLNGEEIRVFESTIVPDVKIENRQSHIGKSIFIQDGRPVVICGKGLLKLNIKVKKLRNRFGI